MNRGWKNLLVSLAMIAILVPTCRAQISPAAGADANSPGGPPSPISEKDIWKVDPISGALSVNIPFPTTPVGGRGPRIPFGLNYNSSSTFVFEANGTYVNGGGGGGETVVFEGCDPKQNCFFTSSDTDAPGSSAVTTMVYEWAPPIYDESSGPTGPWTTTGPFLVTDSSSVPDQIFTVTEGNQTFTINEGTGCNISGPYTYYDQNGSGHDMNLRTVGQNNPSSASPPCSFNSTSSPSTTSDGSMLMTSSGTVLYPDGTQFASGVMEDTNGNRAYIKQGSGQDSLGRSAFTTNIPIGQAGPIPVGTYTVTTTAATGQSQTYTVVVGTTKIGTVSMPHPVFNASTGVYEINTLAYCGISSMCPQQYQVWAPTGTVNVIKSITLPNGTSYGFAYDPNYATISEITFPTGGYVKFVPNIRNIGNRFIGSAQVLSTLVITDVYLATATGATESHWNYSYTDLASAAGPLQSQETAPDGTITNYSGSPFVYSALSYSPTQSAQFTPTWQESLRTISNSSNTMFESVATAYSTGNGYGRPAQIATSMYDGSSPVQKQTQIAYDSYGNVTEEDESDWYTCSGSPCAVPNSVGSAPPGGWLRRTYTTYAYQGVAPVQSPSIASAFQTAHIVSKPSQILVANGSGIPYSLAQYFYDQTSLSGFAGYSNHDDKNYPATVKSPRGNVTTEQHCAVLTQSASVTPSSAAGACTQWLKTTYTYDLAGQLMSKTDPLLNTTSYSYTDSYSEGATSAPTDGYVTKITHPLGYVDTYSYSYSSGQMTSHKDWNLQQTSYSYNDPGDMGRLQSVQNPDTGGYSVSYDDATPPSVTVTTTTGETSGNIVRETLYDGLGRVQQTQLTSDPSGAVSVDTTYDANGRVYSVSNPYRNKNELTYGTTVNSLYDPLDRVKTKLDADGVSSVKYTYAGNCATITDENSNQRTRCSNGLGQMTGVWEPNGVSKTATMETDYGYDVLGNLLSVKQWGGSNGTAASNGPIMRSFAYDSLSRLIAAINPENSSANNAAALTCSGTATGTQWTACYGYDSDGNVVSKTDNRGVSILYTYDGLNRLMSKGYSNDSSKTPLSCYQYGGPKNVQGYQAGRLTNAWTQSALSGQCTAAPSSNLFLTLRTITGYDKMGRVLSEQQCTPSNCSATNSYSLAMNYDLMGNLTSYTNGIASTPGAGSGTLTFAEAYDQAGRLQTLNSTWGSQQLFKVQQPQQSNPCADPNSLFPYSAFGGLSGAVLGNGVTLTRRYDNRLRATCELDSSGTGSAGAYSTGMITIKGAEQSSK